ncbi:MAG: zf-HC2 domain-containing protein [bacterium]|nr:zf-HC2 domain-containing protein [bacterium]MDT8396292.1 zf-HC2 domain-containing protein [bacterium]
MSCIKFERMIDPYLSGDLAEKERARFEAHLENCGACQESVAQFQALDGLLDRASEWQVEPPPYFAQRVMANLPARQASGAFSWRFLHPIVAAVSLVLAIGIGFIARDMFPGPQSDAVISQQVRIIFFSPEADSVALIGDFNEWGQREVTLAQASDRGIWEFSLALDPGVYHYNLLVDGERWVANPKSATLVPDGFGGYNSVLVVSEKCQDDCS